jgi:hypothetical protein
MSVCEKFCEDNPLQSRCSEIRKLWDSVDWRRPDSHMANLYTCQVREYCKGDPTECSHYNERMADMRERHKEGDVLVTQQ